MVLEEESRGPPCLFRNPPLVMSPPWLWPGWGVHVFAGAVLQENLEKTNENVSLMG